MHPVVHLPAVLMFDDYHEITSLQNHLVKIIPDVLCWELGFDGFYAGLYYEYGFEPSEQQLVELLKMDFNEDSISSAVEGYKKYVLQGK